MLCLFHYDCLVKGNILLKTSRSIGSDLKRAPEGATWTEYRETNVDWTEYCETNLDLSISNITEKQNSTNHPYVISAFLKSMEKQNSTNNTPL